MPSIDEKPTADNSDGSNSLAEDTSSTAARMADPTSRKRQKVMLGAGVVCVVLLAAAATTVAVLLRSSFDDDHTENTAGRFDFTHVGEPSLSPTEFKATRKPTMSPSGSPTSIPTLYPSAPPSVSPSSMPSASPSTTMPTATRSNEPSPAPAPPTESPTMKPAARPQITPVNMTSPTLLTFCVIADVPYTNAETAGLPNQIATQMDGCEFLVHLGDIMAGEVPCDDERYIHISNLLLQSEVPTFIIVGDNEWNDCGSNDMIDAAWGRWTNYLLKFEDRWNHTLPVVRNLDYPESFYFIQKRTLIFGLNIVGGRVHDEFEWETRHTTQARWVKEVVLMFAPEFADGVIMLAHATPKEDHVDFFDPMRRLVRDDLGNEIPFLYLHGDGHSYRYYSGFLNQPNFLQIQHMGGIRNPILKILADPTHLGPEVHSAFQVDRQM